VGILSFVNVGGVIMLVTWLAAAAIAATWRSESTEPLIAPAGGVGIR